VVKRSSPLNKRYIRDIKNDYGKYAVIFLLLMLTISFTSGYIIAGDSMVTAYNESFDKYNVEHGHFVTHSALSQSKKKSINGLGVNVYDIFYTEKEAEGHGTLRIFADRDDVNLVCLMSGELPSADNEIAVDRMYAANNGLAIGDELIVAGRSYKICGFVALPDYSALFQDNDDMMFDASLFGTAIVTGECFASMDNLRYCYAWKYQKIDSAVNEKELSDEFMKKLNKLLKLEEYVPRYLNHAITFTGEDLGGDRAMMEVLLYIITAIIAFVYAITTKDTIEKESTVIGTLRATGYTKAELIRHYMVLPVMITLVSAIVGNILGYTYFKKVCADLYYGSYSLTTYTTIWSAEAFWRTTLIPISLMGIVTWLVLRSNLSRSPLQFMRRDLTRSKKKNAVPLSASIPFISRFRTRIILQNIPNYIMLFLGILFASILLMFGLLMPSVMNHQAEVITGSMLSKYQYILSVPEELSDEDNKTAAMVEFMKYAREVETETAGAEKFGAYTLKTIPKGDNLSDEVSLYGVKPGSAYIRQEMPDDGVLVSSLYQDKYGIEVGGSITLKEQYDDNTYSFEVAGIYDYEGSISMFMKDELLNSTFDLPASYFAGYFSNEEIKDIDEKYIGTVIDYDALTKVSRQLMISMGGFMKLIDVFSVALSLILIYLLSKIIIEKNAQSISMIKILGYTNAEASKLYIMSTTIMVIISVFISLFLSKEIIIYLWRAIVATRMSGWIRIYFDRIIYIKMVLLSLGAFAAVAALEMRKIKHIPMTDALKNVE